MEITTISVGRDVLIAPQGADSGRARCPHRAASHTGAWTRSSRTPFRVLRSDLSAIASLGSRRILKYTACALIAAFAIGEAGAAETAPAPNINPEFIKWRQLRKQRRDQTKRPVRKLLAAGSEDMTLQTDGLVPTVIDFSYLNRLNEGMVSGVGSALLDKYDPRPEGVTPVRHQDPQDTGLGTCWAQASLGSVETWLKKNTGKAESLSVKNMVNLEGWDSDSWHGGNFTRSGAYLFRWGGPVLEKDDPYTDSTGIVSTSPSPELAPVYHVQQSRLVPARTGAMDNETLKRAIVEFGGLYATMKLYVYLSSVPYWNAKGAYYCTETGAGHAVTVVGWDDNYSRENFNSRLRPPGNGAFIVKDSYGNDTPRDNGFIYVSYYDTTFAYTPSCAFPLVESKDNYSDVYQYDPLGQVAQWGFPAGEGRIYVYGYGANMFIATANQEVAAVGFYANVPNTQYAIDVYVGSSAGKPVSGSKKLSQTGTTDGYAGYYTIPLKSAVAVTKGQLFSIVVYLRTPGAAPFSFEYWVNGYTSSAEASRGQSFVSQDGKNWNDLTELDGSANFCCKAYARTSAAPVELKSLSSVTISGVSSLAVGNVANFTCMAKYSDGSSKDVTQSAVWSSSSTAASVSQGKVTANPVDSQTLAKVKADYTEGGVTKSNDWSFYVTVAAPGVPTNLSASQGTDASCVRVTWTAPSGASSYSVYRGKTSSSGNATFVQNVTVAKFNDNDAVPGVKYTYFVKAKNDSGTSGFSSGAQGWRALSAPENVEASDGTSLEYVEVKWSEAEGAKYYHVYRSDDIDGEKTPLGSWQTGRTFQDKTATPGKVYYYTVKSAIDSRGNMASDDSIFDDGFVGVPVTLDFLTIDGDASIPSGGSATYACTATYTDKSMRTVARPSWTITSGGAYATVDSSGKVTAKTVSANQSVTLQVSWTDGVNRTATKKITITATKPNPPTAAPVVSVESTGIRVQWSPVENATSYSVYRKSGSVEVFIGQVIGKTDYIDEKAQPGVTYTYRVSATNSAGNGDGYSPYSDSICIPLAAPSGVAATTDASEKVIVTWKSVPGAKYYRVYRAESATGSKVALGSGWQSRLSFDDLTGVAGKSYYYFVQAAVSATGSGAGEYGGGVVGKRPQPVALQSIEILDGAAWVASEGRTVFSCMAHYSDGTSGKVAPEWFVSPSGYAAIDANGQFVAFKVSSDQVVVVGADFGGKTAEGKSVRIVAPVVATAKIINVRTTARWPFSGLIDIDYELQTTPPGTRAFVSVSGFDNDRQKAMAARTLSGDGVTGTAIAAGVHRLCWDVASDYPKFRSSSLGVNLAAVPVNINPPTGLTATPGTSAAGITLAWSAAEGATGYEVWRGTSGSVGDAEKIGAAQDTSFVDDSAVAGETYYYWVRSICADVTSDFGDAVTAKLNPNNYTIVFNANGGSGTMSSLPMVYGTAKNLPLATFEPPHQIRVFDGWALSASGSVEYRDGASVNNLTTVNGGVVTLFAVWKYRIIDLMPLKSLLAILKLDGEITSDTITGAIKNPTLADMDGDTTCVSEAERAILEEVRTLVLEKHEVYEFVRKSEYASISDDDLYWLGGISKAIKDLKK